MTLLTDSTPTQVRDERAAQQRDERTAQVAPRSAVIVAVMLVLALLATVTVAGAAAMNSIFYFGVAAVLALATTGALFALVYVEATRD